MSTGTPDSRDRHSVPPLGGKSLAQELRLLVRSVEASGRAILPDPGDELLQTIVEAAARLFGAAASSIALLDDAQEKLQFRVATGAGAAEVVGMSIPVGQGIAGYVVMTGQPLAVSSVQEDPRFARETARKTGYVPKSILAMPLLYGDRPIGVIEVLDKIDAASFGIQDMELLGIFARQAAIAIRASQHQQHLGQALLEGIQRLVQEGVMPAPAELARALGEAEEDAGGTTQILALADLLGSLSQLGPAERDACFKILATFAEYARSRAGLLPRKGDTEYLE
jgi:GAF domain-containing protein